MTDVLGAAIGKARRQQRMTQAHLAERAGVSRHVIGRIERGHPSAEISIVLALMDALNLTITVTPGPPSDEPHSTHED